MKWAKNWLEILTSLSLVVVTVTTFLQVVFRFALKIPAPWTEEIVRIAFIYMVFMGTTLGIKYHQHLTVDVVEHLPSAIRKWIVQIGYMITILFVGCFTYYSFIFTMNSKVQTTPTLEISMMYLNMIMPISGIFSIYYLIKQFIANFKSKQGGDAA